MKPEPPSSPALPRRLSLVAQTAQSLRENLRAGHWQGHLPGERELCARLQVSRTTLSAALKELEREGWLEVADRRRRRIKAKWSGKSVGGVKIIALLSPLPLHVIPPLQVFLIDELRDKLARAGCRLELHTSRACFSARPARALEELVCRTPAAAWLIMSSTEPMQRWFLRQRRPCLVIGTSAREIALPSVDVDYRATCRHAGGVLLRKGHRRIALVLPDDRHAGEADSEQGLREALAAVPGAHLRVLRHDSTAACISARLDAALRAPHPPTAFLVARAAPVLTVMTHLLRHGRRIPQDAAVISRDDETFLNFVTPAVARYAADRANFARRISLAARQLAETGALPVRAIRLMPKFVPGETV